ncbi:hypothetical protein [Desulfotomaculum nigrificans]|nr:hypothetical protein [Desulfotomaculum nigrificans]
MRRVFIALLSVAIVTLAMWIAPNVTFNASALMEAVIKSGKGLL